MFTGIVETLGKVAQKRKRGKILVFTVAPPIELDGLKPGDSILVNGVCLTVTEIAGKTFSVEVVEATQGITNIVKVKVGEAVNLERALRAEDRLSGHIVTGHIDGVARIAKIIHRGENRLVECSASPEMLECIIPRGSVALGGVSLTIQSLTPGGFTIEIIPFTLKNTNLQFKKVGDSLNLEVDLIGKYVRKFLNLAPKTHRINPSLSF